MTLRILFAAALFGWRAPLVGQVATVEPDTAVEAPIDAGDVRGAAREAQARFERTRLRYASPTFRSGGGNCDEFIGRFCTSYDEGEWYPREEDGEVVEARATLLNDLDSLQLMSPTDDWILGQRVWYRGESGDWEGASRVVRACGADQTWWCAALEGLALHGLGRYPAALETFETALGQMDPELARDWRVPERAVDRRLRASLRDAEDAGPDSLATALATLWTLADPLYLVEGNDRLTAHYARWTASTLRDSARNPYGLSWSRDLEELTVRHGWEVGWERTLGPLTGGRDGAIGHKHPEGRDYLPSGRAFEDRAAATHEDLTADRREPRSLYAPAYAPLLLPVEAYVGVFPRGDHAVLVATAYLPEDTTFHASHDHPRPWLDPADQAGFADRIGFFASPIAGGEFLSQRADGRAEGTLMLHVPAGDYVLSVESWSPELRRAGRSRRGIHVARAPEDIATVSDILLLRVAEVEPESLEESLPLVLIHAIIQPGDALAIAWELSGLGFRPETVEYEVSVERTGRNVFRRLGEFLRLADRPQPLEIAWQEPAPDHPTHQFRHLDLDLPPLDPGQYQVTLSLRTATRSDVEVTRTFQVVDTP